jgi:hypothetical protein
LKPAFWAEKQGEDFTITISENHAYLNYAASVRKFRLPFVTFLFSAYFFCLPCSSSASDTTKILFIGNSYTYVNDLPSLVDSLAFSGGKIVFTGQSTVGGYSLENHTAYSPTLDKIRETNWNFVVLQEQSQIPAIDYYRYNSMYPSSKFLDSLIKLNGSQTMFYMTWGRKNGGQQCINSYCSPVFSSFFHMQDSLRSAYTEISSLLYARLSPVGEAWRNARISDPSIDLWDTDDSHPTLKGSYLAACVFYAVLFGQSPVGLSYTAGLENSSALFLQTTAAQLLLGVDPGKSVVRDIKLNQNYPNPFNPVTIISFSIDRKSYVSLKIFNPLGQCIETLVDSDLQAGQYSFYWSGENYSSGVYFCELTTGAYQLSRKMILNK